MRMLTLLAVLTLTAGTGCRSITAPTATIERPTERALAEPLPTDWPIALEHRMTLKGDRYVFEARLDSPHYPMPGYLKTEGEHTVGWTVWLGLWSGFSGPYDIQQRPDGLLGDPFLFRYTGEYPYPPDREVDFRMYGSHILVSFPAEWITAEYPLNGYYSFGFEYLDGYYDGGGLIGWSPDYLGVIGDHSDREPLPDHEPVAVEWGHRGGFWPR